MPSDVWVECFLHCPRCKADRMQIVRAPGRFEGHFEHKAEAMNGQDPRNKNTCSSCGGQLSRREIDKAP